MNSTRDVLKVFGLDDRACEDCHNIFSVPPYMECSDWKCCDTCAGVRFSKWIETDEGKEAIKLVNANWKSIIP